MSARAEVESQVCSACLSPVPISEGSDSCMICTQWCVWPVLTGWFDWRQLNIFCHGDSPCCCKGAASSLPPVCPCARKRQKDIKWSAWKMFTRHLESFQSRDVSGPSCWGAPVLLSEAWLGAIHLQNWNREDIHPTSGTQHPSGGSQGAMKLWTQCVWFWIHDPAI